MRAEIVAFIREYYDAGHIVNLNADVMAEKLIARIASRSVVGVRESGRFYGSEGKNILCVRAEYAADLEATRDSLRAENEALRGALNAPSTSKDEQR